MLVGFQFSDLSFMDADPVLSLLAILLALMRDAGEQVFNGSVGLRRR